MSARILQSIVLCGLLAVAALTVWAFVPERQREPEPPDPNRERAIKLTNWNHQKVCPAGHETEVVMAEKHLHVDMRLISFLTLEDFQEVPDGCPTDPIFAQSMSFSHVLGTGEFESLIKSRGLPLNYLDLDRRIPERDRAPAEASENAALRVVVEGVGYVDDISTWPPLSSPHSRKYRLHYLAAPGVAPSTITMLCHGSVQAHRWRYCSARYRYGDLLVEYEFRQETDFPQSNRQQAPVKEPDGFLAVDMGVRAWIGDMLQSEGDIQ